MVALVDAPEDFEATLGSLPEGAKLRRDLRGADLVPAFAGTRADFQRRFKHVTRPAGAPVWFVWPKKASGLDSDVTQQVVREYALARGWVDHKVAAIDEVWTGLRFVRRRPLRSDASDR